jgi:hypothetical protein
MIQIFNTRSIHNNVAWMNEQFAALLLSGLLTDMQTQSAEKINSYSLSGLRPLILYYFLLCRPNMQNKSLSTLTLYLLC